MPATFSSVTAGSRTTILHKPLVVLRHLTGESRIVDRDVGRLGPQQLYERFAHETKPRLKLLAPVLGRLESLHETVER
ncbi:hypothetical protein DYH09_35485, partial [bacterium CPR1]|nr:hypothetical protein [bacterium CPR1]